MARARQSSNSLGASDGDTAVTAVTPPDPSVSWATQARKAESAPPENATTTGASSRRRARSAARSARSARSAIDHFQPDAFVALALGFRLHDLDAADLVGRADVGAAVGLLVQAHDVDHPYLFDCLRDHVDLGADQVLVLDGRVPGEELDLDRPARGQLVVDQLLHLGAEPFRQRVELEVHPC